MKKLLPWLLVVLALGGVYFLYNSNQAKSTELGKLQQQVQDVETLRAENAELKKTQVPSDELERLRKNTEDLLRLRNEFRQLSDSQKQLSQQAQKAQTEIQRAQSQAQAAQAQAQAAQAQAAAAAQAQAQAQLLVTNASQALTPDQQAAASRYGALTALQQRDACINNLRQIDSAMQQWALENNKTAQTIPTAQDIVAISAYIKGNALPKCPSGGQYSLNSLAAVPTCSIPGHVLPRQ